MKRALGRTVTGFAVGCSVCVDVRSDIKSLETLLFSRLQSQIAGKSFFPRLLNVILKGSQPCNPIPVRWPVGKGFTMKMRQR